MWDISCAGHLSAGQGSREAAVRELEEELGLAVPPSTLEFLFSNLQEETDQGGAFINNEWNDIYLLTLAEHLPEAYYRLQEEEVAAVKYIDVDELEEKYRRRDADLVPQNTAPDKFGRFFEALRERRAARVDAAGVRAKAARYRRVELSADTSHLSDAQQEVLRHLVAAARVHDALYLRQEWEWATAFMEQCAAALRSATATDYARAVAEYALVNKGPWCVLDEDDAFTPVGPVLSLPQSDGRPPASIVAPVPRKRPAAGTLYPYGTDAVTFRTWAATLPAVERARAMGYFSVVKEGAEEQPFTVVDYSEEYGDLLAQAHDALLAAARASDSESLTAFLEARAEAFKTNDYYASDVAWLRLSSPIDVTIGPYETYIDSLCGLKASFEAVVAITDVAETDKLRAISAQLQAMEDNLPMRPEGRNPKIGASSPIRVANLIFNGGDVGGPQTLAFNLPNDERVVKEHGTAQVMLRNVSAAKFEHLLKPIAQRCLTPRDAALVDFDAFFSHTLCHELSHGIGPHSLTLPESDGGGGGTRETSVRLELQELHSALEEAKADLVGLWSMPFLVARGVLPASLLETIYPTFLAGCIRSVRFGLEEAHGKAQALAFHFLLQAGAFVEAGDDGLLAIGRTTEAEGAALAAAGGSAALVPAELAQVAAAVETACGAILDVQAAGDKDGARLLLERYGTSSEALRRALARVDGGDDPVPVDIAPVFTTADAIVGGTAAT